MTLDLTLSPLYRISGQEIPNLPGLLVVTPPSTAARGREKDRLIVYLLLTGNSIFSTSEYMQVAVDASDAFYQSPGSLTSALRMAAETINKNLLERNMTTSAQGQYAVGWLTLAALRDTQCTLLLSGPMHAYWFGQNEMRHIHEPVVSGKGLGVHPVTSIHYAQTTLSAGDRLLFYGRAPSAWDSTLADPTPSSLDSMRRRLITLTSADLNAVLMQATDGAGVLNLLKGAVESKEDKKEEVNSSLLLTASLPQLEEAVSTSEHFDSADDVDSDADAISAPENKPLSAHMVQPADYGTHLHSEETHPQESAQTSTNPLSNLPRTGPRDFPASIPRIKPPVESIPEEPVIKQSASSSVAIDEVIKEQALLHLVETVQ